MGLTVYKVNYDYLPMSRALARFLVDRLAGYDEGSSVRYLPESGTEEAGELLRDCPEGLRVELKTLLEKLGGHDLSFSW